MNSFAMEWRKAPLHQKQTPNAPLCLARYRVARASVRLKSGIGIGGDPPYRCLGFLLAWGGVFVLVLQGCCKPPYRGLGFYWHGIAFLSLCCNGVAWVLQGCCKGVERVLKGCFKGVTTIGAALFFTSKSEVRSS